MLVRKAFVYRLYPNAGQTAALEWTLNRCRELYNAALQERRDAYRMAGVSVGYYAQKRELPGVKEARPEYRQIGSQILQDVVQRLDRAFTSFFRRVKAGETPGYPRFRSRYRYNSFTLGQAGWSLDKRLYVAGVGHLKVKWSRPIAGTVKTVTVKRDADQWFVVFSCQVEVPPQAVPDRPAVGLDLGLEHYATLSDGTHLENPRYYRKAQDTIARLDRAMRRKKVGSKNRARAALLLRKAHRTAANQRKDLQHKAARRLVQTYGAIAVEDLNVAGLARNHRLAKSICDAGWAQFISILTSKAAEAGVVMVRVNPSGTSQQCSGCGAAAPKTLAERWHHCAACGLSIDRDHNAARNILHRAGLARAVA